jgi:hypothetical protein
MSDESFQQAVLAELRAIRAALLLNHYPNEITQEQLDRSLAKADALLNAAKSTSVA